MDYMDIIPTHNTLRNKESFSAFVNNPELIFKADRPPLILNVEGSTYLNDGHHRLTAALYVGIPLSDIKLQFATYSYAEMAAPNYKIGWLTPYDPRIDVRKNDCLQFKNSIKILVDNAEFGAAKRLMSNKQLFTEPRQVFNMIDLAKTLNRKIPNTWT